MRIFEFEPRKLPPEVLQAIGYATAAWASTEGALHMLIGACMRTDWEVAMACTLHISTPARDALARSVAQVAFEDLDQLDVLDGLLDAVNQAAEKRNAIIHQQWCLSPEGKLFRLKESARGAIKADYIPVTLEELRADGTFIYEAGMALIRFMLENGMAPPAASGKAGAHKTRAARKQRPKP